MEVKIDEKNSCTLTLVRHGETEWNAQGVWQGQKDSLLTERGVAQAGQLCAVMKERHFDVLFSSDLLRTHHTAQILNIDRQLAIQTSQALRERSGGVYEGRVATEYDRDLRALLEKRGELSEEEWKKFKLANDVESDEEFMGRFIPALREISVAYPGKRVLVVTHGGCIRTLLIHLGYAPRVNIPRESFGNCGYVTLQCDGIDFFIREVVGLKTMEDMTL